MPVWHCVARARGSLDVGFRYLCFSLISLLTSEVKIGEVILLSFPSRRLMLAVGEGVYREQRVRIVRVKLLRDSVRNDFNELTFKLLHRLVL